MLPLTLNRPGAFRAKLSFLESGSFLEKATNAPDRDIALTIVGFPLAIGWGRELGEPFSPLSRKSRASSGFIEHGTMFLLEDPSVEGYSGAPVFDLNEVLFGSGGGMKIGGRATGCYGIISVTASDNTGGKMAGVVPIHFAVDLFNLNEAKP